jgi:hypothetical protein
MTGKVVKSLVADVFHGECEPCAVFARLDFQTVFNSDGEVFAWRVFEVVACELPFVCAGLVLPGDACVDAMDIVSDGHCLITEDAFGDAQPPVVGEFAILVGVTAKIKCSGKIFLMLKQH